MVYTNKFKIKNLFKNMISLKQWGTNLFFTDIDKIKEIMLKELKQYIKVKFYF